MKFSAKSSNWSQLRYWLGYGIFAVVVVYSIWEAPKSVWRLEASWVLLTIFFVLAMLPFEVVQFWVFLHHHDLKRTILVPTQFTLRKSIFNSVFPARTGTVFFIYLITQKYKLPWHSYISFMIVSTIIAFIVSGLAFISLLLPVAPFVAIISLVVLGALLLNRLLSTSYYKQSFWLLLTGGGVYFCRLLIYWALLRGMRMPVTFLDASYFAIATNILEQVAITPGNIGIREVLLGLMAPYLSLPTSVGILVGAMFQVLRIVVYAVLMFGLDFALRRQESFSPLI